MYLVTYKLNDEISWGAVDIATGKIYPAKAFIKDAPETLLEYIKKAGCDSFASYDLRGLEGEVDIKSAKLLSPLPDPLRNIFCVGKNYLDHVKELTEFNSAQFSPDADIPIFFTKATTCMNSPYGGVSLHEGVTDAMDYEAELAVIIGKEGVNIKKEDAINYIFGYSVLNDFTARDLQKAHKQWVKGKSLDGYCPMGPWIVTRSEIEDAQDLDISCEVNGQTRQSSNTKNMIFDIARLIEDLSKGMTLLPGDILATGTPSGVGAGFKPPKYLKRGDKVKVIIDKIGFIENEVI